MPLNIPQAVQTLLTGDSAASRALVLAKTAVDPVLQFLNASFTTAADGGLRVLRNLSVDSASIGTANVTGTLNSSGQTNTGNLNATGNTVLKGTAVVQQKDDGTQGGLLVQGNLSVQGNTNSSTGFKAPTDLGVAYHSAAVAGTYYRTRRYTQNELAAAQYNAGTFFQSPFAGSLVGISAYSVGSAGGTATVGIWKNVAPGADKPTGNPTYTYSCSATQFFGSYVSYPKGTYPCGVGDYYQVAVAFSTAGNQFMQVQLWFEFSA